MTPAQPCLRHGRNRVVGVVVGEYLRSMQGELLRGFPDPIVRGGLAEVVTGQARWASYDRDERLAGRFHHVGIKIAPSKTTDARTRRPARQDDCGQRRPCGSAAQPVAGE